MALNNLSRKLPVLLRQPFRPPAAAICTKSANPSPSPKDEVTVLCEAVLKKVPEHGWSDKAITEAIREVKWSPAAKGMLARGPVQVAEHFVNHCNKQLANELQVGHGDTHNLSSDSPHDRLAYAIRTRISMNDPFHSSWSQALALQALPHNSGRAIRSSALMLDEIAHFAGYRSPNFAWYVDRAVVGVVYHSTELYWLTDKSEGRVDTWRFLDSNVRRSSELRSGVGSAFSKCMTLSDAVTGTVSTIIQSNRRNY